MRQALRRAAGGTAVFLRSRSTTGLPPPGSAPHRFRSRRLHGRARGCSWLLRPAADLNFKLGYHALPARQLANPVGFHSSYGCMGEHGGWVCTYGWMGGWVGTADGRTSVYEGAVQAGDQVPGEDPPAARQPPVNASPLEGAEAGGRGEGRGPSPIQAPPTIHTAICHACTGAHLTVPPNTG